LEIFVEIVNSEGVVGMGNNTVPPVVCEESAECI